MQLDDDAGHGPRSAELDNTAGFKTILVMAAILALAVVVTIHTIEVRPAPAYDRHPDPSPLGYTYSLALYAFPFAALMAWALKRGLRLKAAELTVLLLLPLWTLLDVLLGNVFFRFPVKSSTLGFDVWGYVPGRGFERSIPIEEFLFYGGGGIVLILLYVWASDEWYARYSISEATFDRRARTAPALVSFDVRVLAIGMVLFALALGYKKLGPHDHHEGFPGYFTFLLTLVILPASLLFRQVKGFVNGRAFLFTLLVATLVSLLWEVTLALPYGWWNYRERQMIGLFVEPWSGLPVEECALWMAAGWAEIFIYEVIRIYLHSGKSLRAVLFGNGPTATALP